MVLHIGPRKTGTTFLQRALVASADELIRRGIQYGATGSHNHVHAAADIAVEAGDATPGTWSGRDGTAYRELVDGVNAYDGTSIVSAEYLGGLRRGPAARFVRDFACPIDVVVTARDLTRVLPSSWQQSIRNGGTLSIEQYTTRVREQRLDRDAWEGDPRYAFWRSYAYDTLVDRWRNLPGVRSVTVVTVPSGGAEPGLLWHRFAEGTGLPLPADPPEVPPAQRNTGLSGAQGVLLAAANKRAFDDGKDKRAVIRAGRSLVGAFAVYDGPARPPALPMSMAAEMGEWVAADIAALQALNPPIIGSLADLQPYQAAFGDPASPEEVADLAIHLLSRPQPRRRTRAQRRRAHAG